MAKATGPKLTKYENLEPLSTGGMGEVYLAEDTTLRRKVAVKVLSPEWAQDAERFQRFQREARVLATLNHPNIVTIFSVEEEDGVHFHTMELVEGDTLAKIIPSVGLNLDRIFEIAVPLADALAAAHEQGIVHRDLKPGNIMINRQGRVKVLDFGLAKRQDGASGEARAAEPITQEGLLLGTVPYMAPEQLQGDSVDHRADLFSLGVILFEMCTGRRPFEGRTWSDLASSILRDQPASVTALNIYLPRHLGRIIR
ncbi:MAG: serine/threonine-protein kinase, partial [Thermoanaerobaculia bacterium]